MEQRCHLTMVWLTWLGIPLLAILAGLQFGAGAGGFVLLAGIAGQVAYVRCFPRISRWIGYGSLVDQPAVAGQAAVGGAGRAGAVGAGVAGAVGSGLPGVTLYMASVCPFCPIVRRRLAELQESHAFDLREVDVTFRPDVVRAKGLRSVPVIEANGQVLVGNSTSAQIAELLARGVGARAE